MQAYYESLGPSKSNRNRGIKWVPADTDAPGNCLPAAGELTIDQTRGWVVYRVTEFPCDFPGRAFHLEKLSGGGDPGESSYSVFCSHHGPAGDSCECRGYSAHGRCKHRDSIRALLDNDWL